MTLEEAIVYVKTVARANESLVSNYESDKRRSEIHRQLAAYLRELQERRKAPEIIFCKDCRKHNVRVGYEVSFKTNWRDDACPLADWRGKAQGHEFDYQYCVYAERGEPMEKSRAIELLEHLAWDRDIDRNPYGDALNMAIEALKAQLSCEGTTSDLISKTETVKRLRGALETTVPITDYDGGYIDGIESGISTVSTMPTIQPERQKGEWLPQKEGGLRCSKCGGYALDVSDGNFIQIAVPSKFCPHCGADMRGEKDG